MELTEEAKKKDLPNAIMAKLDSTERETSYHGREPDKAEQNYLTRSAPQTRRVWPEIGC